jgi:hypothetical protein
LSHIFSAHLMLIPHMFLPMILSPKAPRDYAGLVRPE